MSKNKKKQYVTTNSFEPVRPLNYIQGQYLQAIKTADITFGIGSAGTGKTYIAASYAAEQLYHRNIDKIIITRPNIEVGKGLGSLPGTLEEKYQPYLEPFEDVFSKCLGHSFYNYCLSKGKIQPKPLGFLRGVTFENSIILLDEAQNLSSGEFQAILSRLGTNCSIIVSGDPRQLDIRDSGLEDAVSRLGGIKGVEVVRFRDEDIVRSEICKQVIMAYNR